jgi:hypothetical protein
MTPKEMNIVLDIIECADGGCSYCVNDLYDLAESDFKEHSKLINKRRKEFKLK